MQDAAFLSQGQQSDLIYAINAYSTFIADRLNQAPELRAKFAYRTQTFQECIGEGKHLNCVLMLLKFICDLMSERELMSPAEVPSPTIVASPLRSKSPRAVLHPRKPTHSRGLQSGSSFKALIEESQKLLSTLRACSPTDALRTSKRSDTEFSPSRKLVTKPDFSKSRSLNFSPEAKDRLVVRRKQTAQGHHTPSDSKDASPQCRLST